MRATVKQQRRCFSVCTSGQQLLEPGMHLWVGSRNHDAQPRQGGGDAVGGVEEDLPEPRHFGRPAARQHGQYRRLLRQLEGFARAHAIGNQRKTIGQRVADEAGIDAMFRVDRRLHREQAKHAVRAAADLFGALFAPCPDRWADVMHGQQSRLLETLFHAEIEIGRVDADHYRRTYSQQSRHQRLAQPQQSRQEPPMGPWSTMTTSSNCPSPNWTSARH